MYNFGLIFNIKAAQQQQQLLVAGGFVIKANAAHGVAYEVDGCWR